jgi:uncharacterized protein
MSTGTPNLTLAVGTQIVTRVETERPDGDAPRPQGAVGVVIGAPSDGTAPYRVRFPDGTESSVPRDALTIRKHHQRPDPAGQTSAASDLHAYVIYRCVVGSRAYGLDEPGSDVDRRGIYLPPADLHWSLAGAPEQLENHDAQECCWELEKFLRLALKANPNILECLYTPLVEHTTPLAHELLAMRATFLSRLIYQTYNGYVLSQFKKLEQDLRTHGTLRWKHAMHLIRLLLSGVTALREGFVPVRLHAHRESLLAIRRGEMAWEDVDAWRLRLHEEFDAALARTSLPDRPDYARANEFLIAARRSMV